MGVTLTALLRLAEKAFRPSAIPMPLLNIDTGHHFPELKDFRDRRAAGLAAFDRLLFGHIGYAISNAARSLVLALTMARFTSVPVKGPTRRFVQKINRYSASFALLTDAARHWLAMRPRPVQRRARTPACAAVSW